MADDSVGGPVRETQYRAPGGASRPWAIVISEEDPASVGIGRALAKLRPWREQGSFDGAPLLSHGSFLVLRIGDLHIHHERLDREFARETGLSPGLFIFASKHKAVSAKHALTVHPIGNFHEARFGGREWKLAPAAAGLQSQALRSLVAEAAGLPYEVSFESTHHGPEMDTAAFFIEIGSSVERWGDARAAMAVSRSILALEGAGPAASLPVAVGVGGGHYSPRSTDAVRLGRADVGHMVPRHHLEMDPERALALAAAMTGTDRVLIDDRDLPQGCVEAIEKSGLRPLAPSPKPGR